MTKPKPPANPQKGGRPQKYTTVQGINKAIHGYFNKQDEKNEPYTVSGLGLHLGLSSDALSRYQNGERDHNQNDTADYYLSDTIKQAKDRIAEQWEKKLHQRGNAGDIFALKNFGWHDKQEIENTHSGTVEFKNKLPRPEKKENIIEGEVIEDHKPNKP